MGLYLKMGEITEIARVLGRHHSITHEINGKKQFSAFLWHAQNIGCCIANSFNISLTYYKFQKKVKECQLKIVYKEFKGSKFLKFVKH